MSEEQLSFNDFLQKEVEKYRGIYVPVKAGLLRRAAIRFAPCKRLHPNPDDEWKEKIIERVKQIRAFRLENTQ